MNKLLVATREGVFLQKQEKILDCMKNFPEGTTPKNISLETGLNVNTVKSILPRLKDVKKIFRGFYKVVERGDSVPNPNVDVLRDWNFHNCILSCNLDDFPRTLIDVKDTLGLVDLHFIISTKGHVTLRLACDWPLNVSSLCVVFGYLEKALLPFSSDKITPKSVFVKTIEFNKDYSNLRLDGVKCITIDSLCVQFKVYQKRRGMRIEHKTKVPFTCENIIDMLSSNPNGLEHNMKLTSMKALLDKQTVATEANTRMLFKLINNMRR